MSDLIRFCSVGLSLHDTGMEDGSDSQLLTQRQMHLSNREYRQQKYDNVHETMANNGSEEESRHVDGAMAAYRLVPGMAHGIALEYCQTPLD